MCSVPRERCAVLGHRALRVLAAGKEEEMGALGSTLSFLSGQRSEELAQARESGLGEPSLGGEGKELGRAERRGGGPHWALLSNEYDDCSWKAHLPWIAWIMKSSHPAQ